ncbi:Putative Holliday junction resolvase [Aequoribacter fuscus]|jgi:putative Holliday junction resolvase|uniref:Putative pre-16S rRNA nuclease n=1 Tax=Aequoribacter fuscus TaxID=2518989 RepID=F3L3I0_9GAMM|nr:Holliday junction resolvase RuvX [Aequoribacter fuscus]EGG29092.1 Putative Holliday junction resolvase [Aequoribacter fuscus]QHJ89249.1 Holliday junction resolvase RuvX [Aequoribacter fuscus]
MSRVLCFDYGLRQIGVAVGNAALQTAEPLCTLKAQDGIPNWDQLAALLEEWQPAIVVVGEPSNMDGTDSDMAARARKFANRIHGRFGVKVALADERLSSFEAKQQAREMGHDGDYKKTPIDALAAMIILQSYFETAQSP